MIHTRLRRRPTNQSLSYEEFVTSDHEGRVIQTLHLEELDWTALGQPDEVVVTVASGD